MEDQPTNFATTADFHNTRPLQSCLSCLSGYRNHLIVDDLSLQFGLATLSESTRSQSVTRDSIVRGLLLQSIKFTRKATSLAIWAIVFAIALWIYFDPVDRFKPEVRSSRIAVPRVAIRHQQVEKLTAEKVADLLAKIKSLWSEKFPDEPMGQFNGPASEQEIENLERFVGPLPVDFKAYLRIHNGHSKRQNGQPSPSFYGSQRMLTCREMLEMSEDLLAIGRGFPQVPLMDRDVWFHPGALIFEENDGAGFVINAANGVIYHWDHDGGPMTPIADSFSAMLERMVRNLQSGDSGPLTYGSVTERKDLGR